MFIYHVITICATNKCAHHMPYMLISSWVDMWQVCQYICPTWSQWSWQCDHRNSHTYTSHYLHMPLKKYARKWRKWNQVTPCRASRAVCLTILKAQMENNWVTWCTPYSKQKGTCLCVVPLEWAKNQHQEAHMHTVDTLQKVCSGAVNPNIWCPMV